MLFVDPDFLIKFLPVSLAGFWWLDGWRGGRWSSWWLLFVSMAFYAFSGLDTFLLFIGSLVTNYFMGRWLARTPGRVPLAFCVGLNLGLLVLYKYADFILQNVAAFTGWEVPLLQLELPLAISFYTFQQIVYLVQCWRSRRSEMSWQDYSLAVSFFPHLIAGPLVHYRELVPQFHSQTRRRVAATNLHAAISIFIIALGKKLLVADTLAPLSAEVFDQVRGGGVVGFWEAWRGTLAYSFQIYFDFSAYSEMALALALFFGIRLPVNFKRPYAAVDLRDFWRRWHITLSEFLRDYVYIPLGGSRCGTVRRWINLFLTMLLGGIWHGAGWNFLAWGALHGLFLAVNHAWAGLSPVRLPKWPARLLTFLVVVFLWVPFRAEDWSSTKAVWAGMVGAGPVAKSPQPVTAESVTTATKVFSDIAQARSGSADAAMWQELSDADVRAWWWVLLAAALVFGFRTNLGLAADGRAGTAWRAFALGVLMFFIIAKSFNSPPGEFIYFRF